MRIALLILGCLLHGSALGQWTCTLDSQCAADVAGSVCNAGSCGCPAGQQLVGPRCVNLATYHTSTCVEDHQCSRLFAFFECRKEGDSQEGECRCLDGYHYFHGRCWKSSAFGATCTQDEECLDVPRDPYNLRCDGTCVCAHGYYLRQKGECRKIGYDIGDGCVLDEDCQFANGICDISTMSCQLGTARISSNTTDRGLVTLSRAKVTSPRANLTSSIVTSARATRLHGTACSVTEACDAPFECSSFGACVCPVGYYASANGAECMAELGSTSTESQCGGLLAEVVDGVCSCPANFFYEQNMRDCIKVTRRITDSCTLDENCYTFGVAAVCSPPAGQWGLRTCACDTEQSVWVASRQMCRLFAGVGELCEVDSDCLAGELEVQCVADGVGQGYCACPDGYILMDGLCLTTGLSIGDACQAHPECTETPNTECINGQCACGDGYQLLGDYCAPIIGGGCQNHSDCVIENTVCNDNDGVFTCQCDDDYVAYNDTCWPVSLGHEQSCNITAQCSAIMGVNAVCDGEQCVCEESYHYRDDNCWPITGLFESCSRTSDCYLPMMSDRVVCRNSLCQCVFDYPYSEVEHTCISAASSIFASTSMLVTALIYLVLS